jgi:hypothetical protein
MVQPKYSPEEALERVKLMMKYDTSKTLNENIISIEKGVSEMSNYDSYISEAVNMNLDEFMENYRETLQHPAMIGLEAFMISTGIGVGAVVGAYTILLIYDIYKGIKTGNWDWFNIVFDILAIVSSGVLSTPLIPLIKVVRTLKFKTLKQVLTFLFKSKLGNSIITYLGKGVNLLSNIANKVDEIFKWISEKTGFKFAENMYGYVKSKLKTLVNEIKDLLNTFSSGVVNTGKKVVNTGKKVANIVLPGEKVGVKQGIKRGATATGIAAGMSAGFNKLNNYLDNKEKEEQDKLNKNKYVY